MNKKNDTLDGYFRLKEYKRVVSHSFSLCYHLKDFFKTWKIEEQLTVTFQNTHTIQHVYMQNSTWEYCHLVNFF